MNTVSLIFGFKDNCNFWSDYGVCVRVGFSVHVCVIMHYLVLLDLKWQYKHWPSSHCILLTFVLHWIHEPCGVLVLFCTCQLTLLMSKRSSNECCNSCGTWWSSRLVRSHTWWSQKHISVHVESASADGESVALQYLHTLIAHWSQVYCPFTQWIQKTPIEKKNGLPMFHPSKHNVYFIFVLSRKHKYIKDYMEVSPVHLLIVPVSIKLFTPLTVVISTTDFFIWNLFKWDW